MLCNNKVFVYDTLKRGLSDHGYLIACRFLGTGWTVRKYALYVEDGIPFVGKDQQVSPIYGELFLVNDAGLENLDRLESHPTWYRREEVEINLDGDSSSSVKAWMYFNTHNSGKLIPSGVFTERFGH